MSRIRSCMFARTQWYVVLVAAVLAVPASAQERRAVVTDSLKSELGRLAVLVDSLRAEVARLREAGRPAEAEDALARLRAAAAEAARERGGRTQSPAPGEQEFEGRQRSLQALNPEISMNADVFGHVDPDDAGEQNFFPREFEISLQSALDPFSRARLFLSHHGEGPEVVPFDEGGEGHGHGHGAEEGEGGGFEVEEGYVEWVSLPGGLGLKVGKFQQRLGTLNRWHAHALPFQSRSLPHLAFVGEEALAQAGVSAHWLAPFGGGARGTYEAVIEVTRSENEALFGESGRPSVLGHVNAFWQLGGEADLDLGLSWVNGSFEEEEERFDRNLYSAEVSFTWAPPARARQRGLNVRGGVMVLDGLLAHEEDGEVLEDDVDSDRALGVWTMAELRLARSWLVGGRFDWAENPEHPDETQWLVSPTLTWWQSEFVRVRAEYDVLSGLDGADPTHMLVVQVTFAMGPHKHESY